VGFQWPNRPNWQSWLKDFLERVYRFWYQTTIRLLLPLLIRMQRYHICRCGVSSAVMAITGMRWVKFWRSLNPGRKQY